MDRGSWWATVHGVAIVGHDLATKPPPPGRLEFTFIEQNAAWDVSSGNSSGATLGCRKPVGFFFSLLQLFNPLSLFVSHV